MSSKPSLTKILTYVATFTLVIAPFNSATYGSTPKATGRVPHIYGSVQFPQNRWRLVRHSFKLVVPQESKALSQLIITVPNGLTVTDNIIVSDQSGQKIDTSISVSSNKIIIGFPCSVVPKTRLKVAMNNVKISGRTNAWLYKISTRLTGLNADIPIGIARFRVY